MLKVSNEFNEAFKSDLRQILVRLTIAGKIYENQDLTSVSYDGGSISGNTFAIGSTVMNSIKVTFCNLVEGLKELDEVKLEIGVVLPTGTVEYAPMGIFIIDGKINMDRNENRTSIECQDRMCMLEGGYKSKLVYPAEIRQVALEIANLAGVKVNEASFARLSKNMIAEPAGYTFRQALGLVAQFQVGFVRFDRTGLIDIRGLEDPEYTITTNEYFLKGLTKNEVFYRLGGISCKTGDKEEGDLQSGSTSGAQITLENKVMTQDMLDSIYEQLKTINYYPYELSWRGNPAIEAGDWLKLEDKQGNMFKTPNLSYTLEFKGGLTAKSSASTDVQSSITYGYKGNLNQKIQWIQDQVVDGMGNTVSTGIDEPTHPKDGDTWFKKVGPDTEIWVYENGEWVFKTTTAENPEIKNAIDEAQKEAETAKNQAQEAYDKSLKAIEDAGFSKDQAKQALEAALQSGADAIQAGKDAVEALNNAKAALKNINDLDQTVKTEITNINDELSQKVSQDTYDGLAGTVKNQSTLISQNKNEIALKADTSVVNTIKGTVDKNTAAILVNTNGIKLKADQSTVNTLTGRVTTAEGQLIVQSGQISQTVSKNELTNTLGSYATQTWTQGQIKSTADNIQLSVSKVQTNLDNLEVGSRNYILLSDIPATGNGTAGANEIIGRYYFSYGQNVNSTLKEGDSFFIAVDYTCIGSGAGGTGTIQFNGAPWQASPAKPLSEKGTLILTGKWSNKWNVATVNGIQVRFDNVAKTRKITVNHARFFFSSKDSGWMLAPEDTASQTDYANLELTVKGIQSTVASKTDSSQVSQIATGIVSTVTNGLAGGQKNLVANSEFSNGSGGGSLDGWAQLGNGNSSTESWYYSQGGNYNGSATITYLRTGNTAVKWQEMVNTATPIAGTKMYSASVMCNVYTDGTPVMPQLAIEYLASDGKTRTEIVSVNISIAKRGIWQKWIIVNSIPKSATSKFVRLIFTSPGDGHVAFSQPMLVNDKVVGNYSQNEISTSQITQLKNDINLRVQKGDVLNQINISPEGILIDGRKVHITGQTSIDNAVIKDAMIATIKADKITAGTINAANVNLINLNASNITAGVINGANLSINLANGQVVFQKGRIHSTSNNIDISLDEGYVSVANANNRVLLKGGGMYFVQPGLFSPGKDNYLSIYNGGSGLTSFAGASVVGGDFISLSNSANSQGLFEIPLGEETFSGISTGKGNGRWLATKVGGANRGIILSGGKGIPREYFNPSPTILVGFTKDRDAYGTRIFLNGEYVHIDSAYSNTGSGSANVIVSDDGALIRSTSASKYKTDITRSFNIDYGEKLMDLPTATWTDKAETKRYMNDPLKQPKPTPNFGMIAEDLANAGLEMLVVRGLNGELEGINYDRIGPALIPIIAQLKNKIEELTQKMEEII